MRRIRSGDFRMMRKRTEGSEMVEIEIGRNEAEQRLDRFLRKYLKGASLSYIYRIIRKDVKVNGKMKLILPLFMRR